MPLSRKLHLLLTVASVALCLCIVAAPVTLVYEWLNPVNFWQKLAFMSLLVLFVLPFRRTRKTSNGTPDAKHAAKRLFEPSARVVPASLSHREMTRGMRETAEADGVLSSRVN